MIHLLLLFFFIFLTSFCIEYCLVVKGTSFKVYVLTKEALQIYEQWIVNSNEFAVPFKI